jgi:citronellol/citronellal dehydrogenase
MAGRFEGRRALVTGASRGIGAAVAMQLAADGADVAIVARTAEQHPTLSGSLATTAVQMKAISRPGQRVAAIVADLASETDRETIVSAAELSLGGPIEILVNNAAAAIYQPMADYPLRRRRLTFEVNFQAPLDLAQAVIPGMRAAGEGWIVNLSSATGQMDFTAETSRLGIYGASKAALNQFTKALAAELAGSGIRVNTVEPRAGVLSEGAAALVDLTEDQLEPMESMVAGVLALCDAPPELTGGIHVSLDLIGQGVPR